MMKMLVVCAMTASVWAAKAPFVGDWKLDGTNSTLIDQMKVANVSGNKYAFDFGGGPETIVVDGTDQAGGDATTLAVTAERPDAWKVVRKKDGRVLLSAAWKLSGDGKTLTDDFTSFSVDGTASTIHYVYQRTAGTSGFAGTWESTTVPTDLVFVMKIRPFGKDGLSFDSAQGQTRQVVLDGKDYPTIGPNARPGATASVRRIDGHMLALTDKVKGQVVDTEQFRFSPDGKTLTVIVHKPGQRAPNTFVFERQ
ncbi:MAG TPA: hypothetical protein VHU41_11000 [Thermoanaerobaculia bacterium]|jgi:hypothetical protein|nr:hypothetical protein [Thermoanaerobaculia bacterium]